MIFKVGIIFDDFVLPMVNMMVSSKVCVIFNLQARGYPSGDDSGFYKSATNVLTMSLKDGWHFELLHFGQYYSIPIRKKDRKPIYLIVYIQ